MSEQKPLPDFVRQFSSGATRDTEVDKPDYEGYLSPLVIERFGQYMTAHQKTKTGVRPSDNWQLGIPLSVYMKSAWRHFVVWWRMHRQNDSTVELEDALCGVIFNSSGYLHELLKSRR